MSTFPKNFLWGAATSSYQVEGGNSASDWQQWSEKHGDIRSPGAACRHYELFREDFDLARSLNHNAHRFSIEWSRIEPEEGVFSQKEIDHYINVVDSLRERGIEPVITLHHFTNPAWFFNKGGWLNKDSVSFFLRYAEKMVSVLCSKARLWITINEPLVCAYESYLSGAWPPKEKSFIRAQKARGNLIRAHVRAYSLIHDIYRKMGLPDPLVSVAKHFRVYTPYDKRFRNTFAAGLRHGILNTSFMKEMARAKALDFIGVNYYTRTLVNVKGFSVEELLLKEYAEDRRPVTRNSLGWEVYPEGMYELIMDLKRYDIPILITENGMCTDDDGKRWDFIQAHLKNLGKAIAEGANVLGYMYWSFIDNYEWAHGFDPRFGIVEMDYATYRRTPRESAGKFAEVCRTGEI